jgi:hypothetical protein
MESSFSFDDVPHAAVRKMVATIQEYGVESFFTDCEGIVSGSFKSVAGTGRFMHQGRRLTVTIVEDRGHFSRLMITGGLKQLVSEAVEAC